jgi:hypothetical protein
MSKSEPYTGPVSAMRKSPYLASDDISDAGEIEVVIEGVFRDTDVEMEGGRTEKELFTLKFVGQPKRMVLNATNVKTLSRSFGSKIENWKGKKLKLFVQTGVKAFGKITTGLRVKPDAKAAAQQKSDDAANALSNKVK